MTCRYNWKPEHDCNKAARLCLRAFETFFDRSRGIVTAPGESDSAHAAGKRGSSRGVGALSVNKAGGKRRASATGTTLSSGGAEDHSADASPDIAPPQKKRGRPAAEPSEPDHAERSAKLLQGLSDYLVQCGGDAGMVDGWYTKTEYRKEGATAGTYDTYFFSPQHSALRTSRRLSGSLPGGSLTNCRPVMSCDRRTLPFSCRDRAVFFTRSSSCATRWRQDGRAESARKGCGS